MPEHAAIAFEDVSKRFGDAAPALAGVSFDCQAARIPGHRRRVRLRQDHAPPAHQSPVRADGGRLRIGGVEAHTLDPTVLRRRIGYVFQEVGLFPHMTVAENIAITPRLLDWDEQRQAARADELLGLVRLDPSYRTRFPHQLSGGERQRVGVARALAAGPDVVLMDEPFAALDPLTRDGLAQDYRRLHDELRLTTVMITHDVLEALGLADRIVVLQAGRIIAEGTPSGMMAHQHAYVRELMQTPRRVAERVGALLDGKER